MKSLKNCIKLKSQVKIYVPSTTEVDKPIENNEWVDKTLTFLSSSFGGATTTKALGAWITNDGKLVKENVNLCFAFADQSQLENKIDEIYNFCVEMKIELKQEAIALEVNGELYLI